MATNSTLRADSCHPPHVIKNIPVIELIRLKRNCWDSDPFKTVEKEALDRLRARGYPEWSLNRAINIVANIDREDMLKQKGEKEATKCKGKCPHWCFRPLFSPQYCDIVGIIQIYVPILHSDKVMTDILSAHNEYVSRRSRTVGNVMSPSVFPREGEVKRSWPSTAGFFKCGHTICHACSFAMVTKTFF